MHVDHAEAGEREENGPEDVAVGDDDAQVGLEAADGGEEEIAERPGGLVHRDPGALRLRLDRRSHERGAGPTLRAVRLRHHAHDVVSLPEQ